VPDPDTVLTRPFLGPASGGYQNLNAGCVATGPEAPKSNPLCTGGCQIGCLNPRFRQFSPHRCGTKKPLVKGT
jgi:hypothetical protein